MRSFRYFLFVIASIAGFDFLASDLALADGRAGSVEWSDGHKQTGAISLTPGKDLRLFTATGPVAVQLSEVAQIKFTPEKEEMREGFYFPNAGQATQAKTGETYPTRSIQTEITLADGKVLQGHLFTTTLYVEMPDNTEKVVLMAKQTGGNGQKLADLIYPTLVHFDGPAASAGTSWIDLNRRSVAASKAPVVVAKPDLSVLPITSIAGNQMSSVPMGDASRILFSVEASDGIHVAWQEGTVPGREIVPEIKKAVEMSLKEMQDFYDTRTLLGCFADGDDAYSLVMMKRLGPTNGFPADRIPWSLVVLHWKYDADQKKTTLLNRASLAMGRIEGNSAPPHVLIDLKLRDAITPPHQPSDNE